MIDLLSLVPLAVSAAAEAETGNGTQLIIAALGAGSVGAVIAAMVTGLFTKRKLGAEATEIITKAASGVVETLNAEIIRLNAATAVVRTEQAADAARHRLDDEAREARHKLEREADQAKHARELDAIRRVLQLHVAWDLMARAKLSEHGINLPEPPPLRPALLNFDEE